MDQELVPENAGWKQFLVLSLLTMITILGMVAVGYAAIYFSIALIYTLTLCLPAIGIGISYKFLSNAVIKYGIIGLLLIPLVFLAARYCLAIPSAILIGDSGGLKSSMLLVKGYFWSVLSVLALTQGIIMVFSDVLSQLAERYTESGIIISLAVLQVIFQVLAGPVGGIATTVMYLFLNDRKQIDMVPIQNEEGTEMADK